MKISSLLFILLFLIIISCKPKQQGSADIEKDSTILEKVDVMQQQIDKSIKDFNVIASLDHHRMAKESGVYTPPAILNIFSNPKINTDLIAQDQLIGLDLPYKLLCYSEPDTTKVSLAYTSAEFISKRHGIPIKELNSYSSDLNRIIKSIGTEMISPTDLKSVDKGFGIVQIASDFDFDTTVANLRAIVAAQSDTRWFGEVDYKKDGADQNPDLRPTILLLFGGPAPGGKAMVSSPKIGLDAFCQKLLVYEDKDAKVWVAFNDIVSFAELYYNSSTKPQVGINKRLITTFTKVVTKE